MKKVLIALLPVLIAACNSDKPGENSEQQANETIAPPPSQVNDLMRMRYNGHVKKVHFSSDNIAVYTAEGQWVISDSAKEIITTCFDTAGNEFYAIHESAQSGTKEKYLETNTTNENGGKISHIKNFSAAKGTIKSKFLDDFTNNSTSYIVLNKDTSNRVETRTTYDKEYRIVTVLTHSIDDSIKSNDIYTHKGDTSFVKSYIIGRKDTFYNKIIILEKDKKGNRTKVVNIDEKTGDAFIMLREFEYYP
jgi:hypothetical protein